MYQLTEKFAADLIHVIDVVKADPTDEIWSLVDTSKVAISGHSMGAVATVYNAAKYGKNAPFAAAMPLHPCPNEAAKIADAAKPMFYGTGSDDTVCSVPLVREQFEAVRTP